MWAVLAFALLLRLVFYTGFFGSDEVTYVEWAFKLLDGDWTVSDYVGANRYGVNLPIAGFALLFGRNEFGAAAYAMVCALAEIALVASVGRRLVGDRAAVLAALVLACLPTHVHLAGRLMADTPLTLAMTASFLYFFDGELRQRTLSYLIAGCAAGFSFWIKPAAVIYLAVFLIYPLVIRRFDWRWGWMVLGFALVVATNFLLYLALTGDALYLVKSMAARRSSGYLEAGSAAGAMRDSPTYYLQHLFMKVHHTWLLGPLAAFGAVLWVRRGLPREPGSSSRGLGYVVFWAVALLAVLSLFVVSLRPLLFVPKQTNYMLMFVAPLALLAGSALASLKHRTRNALLVLTIVPSVLLAALLQGAVHTFTANSKAAVHYVATHPGAPVFSHTNPEQAATFHNNVRRHEPVVRIGTMTELSMAMAKPVPLRVILDQQTIGWSSDGPLRSVADAPSCWVARDTLTPVMHSAGTALQSAIVATARALPVVKSAMADRLSRQFTPQTATVFDVPGNCR